MLPIHNACLKGQDAQLRPALTYIGVVGPTVYATNAHLCIRVPKYRVFPEYSLEGGLLIPDDENLYFNALAWKRSNLHKAVHMKRDGLRFFAFDKDMQEIGSMVALSHAEFDADGMRFPDCDAVFPTEETTVDPITYINFDPELLRLACSCFGAPSNLFTFEFFGIHRAIRIIHYDCEGDAIVMPFYNKAYEEMQAEKELAKAQAHTAEVLAEMEAAACSETKTEQEQELAEWEAAAELACVTTPALA